MPLVLALRVQETIDWLLTEMRTGTGAFAASFDADSEGEEGKFYLWTLDDVQEVLGPDDAKLFAGIYDVTQAGNFEGHNILNRLNAIELRDDDTEGPSRTDAGETLETSHAQSSARV